MNEYNKEIEDNKQTKRRKKETNSSVSFLKKSASFEAQSERKRASK